METEFKAFIELIYYQRSDETGIKVSLPQVIVHTTGRTDDNGRINASHRAVLFHCRTSAVATHCLKGRTHRLKNCFYLQGKFARRGKHHRLNALYFRFERLYQRQ